MEDNNKLQFIKDTIEAMSKSNQIEILKILKNDSNVKLNENKNGVFVNLSYLPLETIKKIDYFLSYINNQEKELEKIETQKKEFQENFFIEN
jgi:hypothetical protein